MKTKLIVLSLIAACLAADAERVFVGSLATKDDIKAEVATIKSSAWVVPGAWLPTYVVDAQPTNVVVSSVWTNELELTVFDTQIESMSYSLRATLGHKILDPFATEGVGEVAFLPTNGGTVEGNVFIAPAPGVYRLAVTATADPDFVGYMDVPLTSRRGSVTTNRYYIADAPGNWRKQVNDDFLAVLNAATWQGTNQASGVWFDKWFTTRCPARPVSGFTVQGYRSRNALSPHLLIAAEHYGKNGNTASSVFYDPTNHTYHTVRSQGYFDNLTSGVGFKLTTWAMAHGWSAAELADMHIDDVVVYPVSGSTLVPENCCPSFITLPKLREKFGGGAIGAWAFTQTSLTLTSIDGVSGTGNVMTPVWLTIGDLGDTATLAAYRWTPARYGLTEADVRRDIRQRVKFMAEANNAGFPPIYGGDSSGGVYICHNGEWVMVSFYTTMYSGPCLSAAVPVLRELCAAYGDTLKEVE